jgi:hypothetical protein
MENYIAKLMFQIETQNKNTHQEYDEQIRLIKAPHSEAAYFKAHSLGKHEEDDIENLSQKKAAWKFIGVSDLIPLEKFNDGQQLFSNTIFQEDSHGYTQFIKHKAIELQMKNLSFA